MTKNNEVTSPVDVLAVMDNMWLSRGTTQERDYAEARSAVAELIEAARTGYTTLADIHNEWPGRYTREGQRTLCRLRDAIASATGADPEDVQNAAAERAALARVGCAA